MMRIFPELAPRSDDRVAKKGFWRRQFLEKNTRPQLAFDVVFGVVAPVLCFVFDPIAFRSGLAGPPLFPDYQAFVYLFSGLEIVLLSLWLVMGKGAELSNAMIGGALLNGGLFCFVIGVVLFPFSLMGIMFFGIGLFGFIPFLTGLVYLRNGWRTLNTSAIRSSRVTWATGAVCGLLLVTGIPIALSMQIRSAVTKSVDVIIRADPVQSPYAVQQLAVLRFFASGDLERIVQAYASETDANRKELLKSRYREITGEDIETRVVILQD